MLVLQSRDFYPPARIAHLLAVGYGLWHVVTYFFQRTYHSSLCLGRENHMKNRAP
jgi:hypothetical protein